MQELAGGVLAAFWDRVRAMPVTDSEARRFVAEYYGRRAADVRGLGAGEWSRAYEFILDGREAVIRFGGHAEDFRKDQVMAAHSAELRCLTWAPCTNPCTNQMQKALSLFEKGPLALVAGAGFEPATSGL
jgi:hypothetical protein